VCYVGGSVRVDVIDERRDCSCQSFGRRDQMKICGQE
jgi:hypothetical protein